MTTKILSKTSKLDQIPQFTKKSQEVNLKKMSKLKINEGEQ